jgi:anti-sigma factor (TIGR02949 family)
MKTDIRSCEEALRLLAAHLDGELSSRRGQALDEHLDTCRSCYSRAEFERRLKDQVASLGRETVRPELAERVSSIIRTFSVAGAD